MAQPPYPVHGKTILITGAARGIGAETARRLSARGASLALVGLEPEMLEEVARQCGDNAACFEADVTDRDALQTAVDGVVECFGGIDVVMANAGIGAGGTVRAMDPSGWERVIEVNLLGVYRTINVCLPHVIERRGYVLPVSSMASSVHGPGMSAYSAAKAAVEALGNCLRSEVRHLGVDVGVAYYSWIDTEMVRGADSRPGLGEWRKNLRGPAGRTFTVEEAGEATAAGIEARARRIVVPKSFNAVLFARMAFQRLGELQMRKDAPALIAQVEAEAQRDPAASQPVGAGGAADVQARSHVSS